MFIISPEKLIDLEFALEILSNYKVVCVPVSKLFTKSVALAVCEHPPTKLESDEGVVNIESSKTQYELCRLEFEVKFTLENHQRCVLCKGQGNEECNHTTYVRRVE